MELQRDDKNQLYTEVGNIRLTYIPARARSSHTDCHTDDDTDWAHADVIRFQLYRGEDRSLDEGAELPIQSSREFFSLVSALCQVYAEGRSMIAADFKPSIR